MYKNGFSINNQQWLMCYQTKTIRVSFFNLLGTIPRAPTTISITLTLMFHNFFSSLAKSIYIIIIMHTRTRGGA